MLIDIKHYVDFSGISKNELAKKLDISYPTMLSLYSGEAASIRFDTLEKLCIIFKCTPNDILKFEQTPTAYNVPTENNYNAPYNTLIENNCNTPIYERLLTLDPNIEFEIIRLPDGRNVAIPYLIKQNNKSDTML